MLKPPPDFRSKYDSTPPPILVDGDLAILENEKIERYIMKNIPGGHNLFISDKETATVIENLYSVSIISLSPVVYFFYHYSASFNLFTILISEIQVDVRQER